MKRKTNKPLKEFFRRLNIRFKYFVKPYVEKAKKVSFPGFEKIPIYDVITFFFRGLKDGALGRRASAVAYSLILAIFPGIIVMFTLIPYLLNYIPIASFQPEQLTELIVSAFPSNAQSGIQRTIEEVLNKPHASLLSFGFAMLIIFSTNGFVSLIRSFNATIHTIETRSWLEQRVVALLMVFIFSLLIIISITLITFTQTFMNFLVEKSIMKQDFIYYAINSGKWLIIVATFFIAYSTLFYLAPSHRGKWRFISAGGTLATILSIIVTLGFKYYIDNFGRYNALYGSIGTLPIVMIMIQMNCMAMIIGFELNAGINAARQKINGLKKIEAPKEIQAGL